MLTTGLKILKVANKHPYAIPAFNFYNLETLLAILEGAQEMNAPVIVQTSEGAISYAGMENLVAMVLANKKIKIPFAFHVDHGKDEKIIKKAIKSGYTSVMIDASHLEYKENIKATKRIVTFAHRYGVSVEAELGAIKGIEDNVSVSEKNAHLTDPKQAKEFVKLTGCDYLAVSIGTAHGAFKFKADTNLDLKRLKEISKLVKVPLVLHGASTVPRDMVEMATKYGADLSKTKGNDLNQIKKAVKFGIDKVNIDTDLRIAFDAGIRRKLAISPEVFDPRKILNGAKENMKIVVKRKIELLGCKNKAKDY